MMLGYLLKVLKELSVGTSNKRALDGALRLFFLFLVVANFISKIFVQAWQVPTGRNKMNVQNFLCIFFVFFYKMNVQQILSSTAWTVDFPPPPSIVIIF